VVSGPGWPSWQEERTRAQTESCSAAERDFQISRFPGFPASTAGLHYMWKRGKETRRRRVENEIRGKKRKKKKERKKEKRIIKILYK
tara:strand:+ start:3751 stop:4011 length:261 start_codon:yes stop_codon:yes gene_type:complete